MGEVYQTLRKFQTNQSVKSEEPCRCTLVSLIETFKETEVCMTNDSFNRFRSGRSLIDEDSIHMVEGIIETNPHSICTCTCSIQKMTGAVGLLWSSVMKVLRKHF